MLAGCVAMNGGRTPTESPDMARTSSSTPMEPPEGVFLGLTNDTDSEQLVTVTIRRDGDRVFEETVTLSAGERIGRPAVVTERGEYRITVVVDSGPTRTVTQRLPDGNEMPLDSYILEVGVRTDDVTFVVLHGDPAPEETPSET